MNKLLDPCLKPVSQFSNVHALTNTQIGTQAYINENDATSIENVPRSNTSIT